MEFFPKFAPLSFQDKPLVDLFLKKEQPTISEMTFANMYAWRKTELVEASLLGKSMVLRGRRKDGDVTYAPPVGADDKVQIVKTLIGHSLKEGSTFLMRGIVEPLATRLAEEGYELAPDRNNWDYVYLTSDLANLPGPKFYGKRKEIKKFRSRYRHECKKITPSIIQKCVEFQEEWYSIRNCRGLYSLMEENYTILDALQDFDKLGLSGLAVFVDGELVAFSIGEMLNDNTWVTHFEKASPEIQGLYQYINQQIALEVLPNYMFINREQDLGEKGLRMSKTSYHPHHMVEKNMLLVEK